jgi:hypothetical protein
LEVLNFNAGNLTGLTAKVEIFNLDGRSVSQKSATLDSPEDSTQVLFKMQYPAGLTAVHFLRLTLTSGAEVLSTNFYLRGLEEGNYKAIRQLPKPQIKATTTSAQKEGLWLLTTEVRNTSTTPALMVRIQAIREKSGDRILPAIYSDNYIALMPAESQTITTELKEIDTRGEKPVIVVA